MYKRYLLIGPVLFLFYWICDVGVVYADSQDDSYVSNIKNYIYNIKTFRYDVKAKGYTNYGVNEMPHVMFYYESEYNLVSDEYKKYWKLESKLNEQPVGLKIIGDHQFTTDELKELYYPKHNTINKTKGGYAKYFHKDSLENTPNMQVLMGFRQTRDQAFRAAMQIFDPRQYIKKAIPDENHILIDVKNNDSFVTIRYEMKKKPGLYKVVVLAKEYGYLPIKITSEGNLWKGRKGLIEISYSSTGNGFVVDRISYNGRYGPCENIYTNVSYNENIQEDEFAINIPPDALIVDDLGNIFSYGQFNEDEVTLMKQEVAEDEGQPDNTSNTLKSNTNQNVSGKKSDDYIWDKLDENPVNIESFEPELDGKEGGTNRNAIIVFVILAFIIGVSVVWIRTKK